eukprot:NODE_380_length_9674_cov_0.149452.p1 type:complete len:806 gc:universal NODE_380_length_9674_cov_0.149452:7715-5298(-)
MLRFFNRKLIEVPKQLLSADLHESLNSPNALDMCCLYMSHKRLADFDWQLYHDRFLIRSIWPFIAKQSNISWNDASSLLLLYSHFDDYHSFPFDRMKSIKPISLMMGHSLLFCIAHSNELAFSIKEKKVHVKSILNLLTCCGIPLTDTTIRLAFDALTRKMRFTTKQPNNFDTNCAVDDITTIQKRLGIPDNISILNAKLKAYGSNRLFQEMFDLFDRMPYNELSLVYLFKYASYAKYSANLAAHKYLPLLYKFANPSRDLFYQAFKIVREGDAIDQVVTMIEMYNKCHQMTPRIYDLLIRILLVQYGRTTDIASIFKSMKDENIGFSSTTYYHLMTYYSTVESNLDELYGLIEMISNRPSRSIKESDSGPLYSKALRSLQSGFNISSFLDFLYVHRDYPEASAELVKLIPLEFKQLIPPSPSMAHPSVVEFDTSCLMYDSKVAGNQLKNTTNWADIHDDSLIITTDHFINENTPTTKFNEKSLSLNTDLNVAFDGRMCVKLLTALISANDLNGALYYWSRLIAGLKYSMGSYYKSKHLALQSEYNPLSIIGKSSSKTYENSRLNHLKDKYSPFQHKLLKQPNMSFYPRPVGLSYPIPGYLYLPADLAKSTLLIIDFIQSSTILCDYPLDPFLREDFFNLQFYKTDHGQIIQKWMGHPSYSMLMYPNMQEYLRLQKPLNFSEIPNRKDYEGLPTIQDSKALAVIARRLFLDTVSVASDTFIDSVNLKKFAWFRDIQQRLGLDGMLLDFELDKEATRIENTVDYGRMTLGGANSDLFYDSINTRELGVFDQGPADIDNDAYSNKLY